MRGLTLFLLLLTCAFHPLTCARHRRILHEPLFPPASLSPTSPPSPPAPFFQAYPSSPPPPPSPLSSSGAGASDPANISSLSVPKPISPASSTSRRLLAVAVAAFAIAAAVGSATVFCYFRRKRRRPFAGDDKPPRSEPAAARNRRARAASGASTEFLYIGNLASSHSHGGDAGDGGGNAIPRLGKLESPELRPLPPLQQQGFRQCFGRENVEEDLYSPNRSLGGLESSVAAGSAPAVVAENFSGGSSDSSSLTSCSDSPTRSASISISPAVSLSPRSSRPKSQDFTAPTCAPLPDFGVSFGNRSESPSLSSNSSSSESQSPARTVYVPQPPPPPHLPHPSPPPPPLLRYSQPVLRPPVLPAPSKPVMWQNPQHASMPEGRDKFEELPKPKLKPLHWDKVKASDREMVWDQLKSSSFKVNEEMIETLFMVNGSTLNSKKPSVLPSQNQVSRVLDPKKSQNISILLKALNVTTEKVCEALLEGNPSALGNELIECLLKMAPSNDEECKLKEFEDDSEFKLNPAENFLKAIIGIPYAFKRLDVMLFISNFASEADYLKKSFQTLEAACEELRNSRMFMKLLEAVLKTGNRMNIGTNRGDARAFKLDTLLKLVDVKGTDGRTTLLHFVVQEIVRTEGARFNIVNDGQASNLNEEARRRNLGLQVVSSISSELANVKKAAAMDSDVLASDLAKIFKGIKCIKEVVRLNESLETWETTWKFSESMRKFMVMAEDEIIKIQAQESVALSLVKEITEYFHGNSVMEEAHPFRIFMVVRDFLAILDRVCKEVGMIHEQMASRSARRFLNPVSKMLAQADSRLLSKWRNNTSDYESLSP